MWLSGNGGEGGQGEGHALESRWWGDGGYVNKMYTTLIEAHPRHQSEG